MQVTVTGRHMTVNDSTRAYAEEKFGRISKIYDAEPIVAEVVLYAHKNPAIADRFVAEVTVRLKGHIVRAQESAGDMHAAIDLAADKAEAQMRKYKDRVVHRRNGRRTAATVVRTAPGDSEIPVEVTPEPEVVRLKKIEMSPMTEEEAILQLELLGHDFFVFEHADDGLFSVIYRRTNGDFGMIQPTSA
jgi:putative sigma-54 modulation protein